MIKLEYDVAFIKTSRTLKPACEKHSTEGTENTTKKTNKSSLRLLMPFYFNVRTSSLRKTKTTKLRKLPVLLLRSFRIARTQNLSPITPSSAAVCKLVFCGSLLRSKTTKKRLTNCRAHEVCGAAAPCYGKFYYEKSHVKTTRF